MQEPFNKDSRTEEVGQRSSFARVSTIEIPRLRGPWPVPLAPSAFYQFDEYCVHADKQGISTPAVKPSLVAYVIDGVLGLWLLIDILTRTQLAANIGISQASSRPPRH